MGSDEADDCSTFSTVHSSLLDLGNPCPSLPSQKLITGSKEKADPHRFHCGGQNCAEGIAGNTESFHKSVYCIYLETAVVLLLIFFDFALLQI
jgi:hypothetical protein